MLSHIWARAAVQLSHSASTYTLVHAFLSRDPGTMSAVNKPEGSIQSTPTPPSSGSQSGRSRRSLRKCATPIKSAQKDDQGERVTLHRLSSLTDTSSTNTTITPDSAVKKVGGSEGAGV